MVFEWPDPTRATFLKARSSPRYFFLGPNGLNQALARLHIFQAPRSILPLKCAKFLQSALSLFGAFLPCKLSNIAAFIEYIIRAFFTAMYKNSNPGFCQIMYSIKAAILDSLYGRNPPNNESDDFKNLAHFNGKIDLGACKICKRA